MIKSRPSSSRKPAALILLFEESLFAHWGQRCRAKAGARAARNYYGVIFDTAHFISADSAAAYTCHTAFARWRRLLVILPSTPPFDECRFRRITTPLA